MDSIWWRQIIKANQFIYTITTNVLQGKSIVLHLPEYVPWRDTMYDLIEGVLHSENPEYRVDFVDYPSRNQYFSGEVGQFLLEKYCKKEKRSSYRPIETYAEFLAKSDDIVLNSLYVWLRNVPREDVENWGEFIVDYSKNLPKGHSGAVFVLEVQDITGRLKSLKGVKYISMDENIDAYDRYTFCALASTDVSVPAYLRPYLAELVSSVCQEDVELCSLCINQWDSFIKDPINALKAICDTETRSDGTTFEVQINPAIINPLIWEAQLKVLFPKIEKFRSGFIKKHYHEIMNSLPIKNANGDNVNDPVDVEIGALIYLAGQKKIVLNTKEYERTDEFRKIRNELAHLTPVEYYRAKWVLEQG